ncbi:hypothetical protein EBX31_12630 [bacterium]|nr:hypothetical protein [bacterium]
MLCLTQEAMQVDFYSPKSKCLCGIKLTKGDPFLMVSTGPGFRLLSDLEMFEVKQGPDLGKKDKRRFPHHSGPFCYRSKVV